MSSAIQEIFLWHRRAKAFTRAAETKRLLTLERFHDRPRRVKLNEVSKCGRIICPPRRRNFRPAEEAAQEEVYSGNTQDLKGALLRVQLGPVSGTLISLPVYNRRRVEYSTASNPKIMTSY
jgi:hypothetical protein